MSQTATHDAVTVGHDDMGTSAVVELKFSASCGGTTDEVVCRARIQERGKLMCAHSNAKLHGVRRPDTGDRREGYQGLVRVERVVSRWRSWCVIGVVRLLDDVIGGLEKEQPGTLMAPDVQFIIIIAEALLPELCHLVR